jgi:uncharacterized protein YdaU (DUF1376 family)
MHYYQFNLGDYASHTQRLSPIEDLAYRRLIDFYYLHERPPSGEPDFVAREIGLREYVEEVEYILDKFFDRKADCWVHRRIEKDIQAYKDKLDQASKAGKASAKKRAESTTKQKPTESNDRSTTVQPTNNHKPITNNHKPYNNACFDSFWKSYPRKTDKQKALKAFEKLNPDNELLSKIISHCSAAYSGTEKRYIPHPTTYLNGSRWEDEIIQSVSDEEIEQAYLDAVNRKPNPKAQAVVQQIGSWEFKRMREQEAKAKFKAIYKQVSL